MRDSACAHTESRHPWEVESCTLAAIVRYCRVSSMGPLAGQIARVVATGTKHIWQQDVSDEDIAIATAVVCVVTQVKAVGVALCAMC